MKTVRVEVTADEAGRRLDLVLTSRLPDHTRSRIQRLIRDGHAHLGDQPVRTSHIVRTGEVVTLVIPPPRPATPTPEALPIDIVYDDPDLLVVDKPAGMVVHPAAGHATGTLVNALLHHVQDLSGIGGELRPGIVHRLDRGTSGLMVVAKHDTAHAALARQFRIRAVEKRYTAMVWGEVEAGTVIDLPIGRDPRARQKISTRSRRPRTAHTDVVMSMSTSRGGLSLLEVRIATGRTHQIRVHLSAIGHPIVADPTYGGKRRIPPGAPDDIRVALQSLRRPFLHASHLAFRHPADDRPLTFESELPPDLQAVIDVLQHASQP